MTDQLTPPATRSSAPGDRPTLAALLERVGAGDRTALAQLYDATAAHAFGIALGVGRDRCLAEDVVLKAYLDVWRTAAGFDPAGESALGWISTVVHGRAVEAVRSTRAGGNRAFAVRRPRRLSERTAPQDDLSEPAGPPDPAAPGVRSALEQINARQRETIELAYFDGYTHTEIDRITGMPAGMAKVRIRDGLIGLRDLLALRRGGR